jgi:uncharacterized membrane protein YgaE (UPF0421/DUF939 family)
MKHINTFEMFEKHVYNKATTTSSKNWAENYKSLLAYLVKQIEERQLTDYKNDGDVVSFKIKGRKYRIDLASKLFLYKTTKGVENESELELTSDQLSSIIDALKKPIKSKNALKSTKKHPDGRKPYLD